jgi:hypothetical protein
VKESSPEWRSDTLEKEKRNGEVLGRLVGHVGEKGNRRMGRVLRRKGEKREKNKRKGRKRNLESFPNLKILGKKVKGEKKEKNKRKGRERNLESFPNMKILGKKVKGTFMISIKNGFIKDQDSERKKISE